MTGLGERKKKGKLRWKKRKEWNKIDLLELELRKISVDGEEGKGKERNGL